MALGEALQRELAGARVNNSATFKGVLHQFLVRGEEVLQHLLRVLEELVAEEVQLLDVRLADWHPVSL